MNIHNKIECFIDSYGLFRKSDKILLGVSGGADSVAMLCLLHSLGYNCQIIHCNFHLRGVESGNDEKFVRELCLKKDLPLTVVNFDTVKYASERSISIEMAARELRYKTFEEHRKAVQASVIGIAHHKDDSVETLLINLIRGTGLRGLTGIKPVNGNIVRPLLCLSRVEIIEYLDGIGQSYVIDSTNLEDNYVRNKIRNRILPLMREINPSIDSCVLQTSKNISEALIVYNDAIDKSKSGVLKRENNSIIILIDRLLREVSPEALLYEILYPMGFNPSSIENIRAVLNKESGKLFYSERYVLLKDRNTLIIRPVKKDNIDENCKETVLLEEGVVSFFDGVELQIRTEKGAIVISKDKFTATLDADLIEPPIIVRKWQSGDRFLPYGMSGFKNVSDYLTDLKFDLFKKNDQLVVCDSKGIIWLAGERIDNRYSVTKNTEKVLIISMKRKT